MFSKLITEVGENKNHSFCMTQRIKEDKGKDKDFLKLPSATSSIQNSWDDSLIHKSVIKRIYIEKHDYKIKRAC